MGKCTHVPASLAGDGIGLMGCDGVKSAGSDGVSGEGVRLAGSDGVRGEGVRLALELSARANVGRASAVSSESLRIASAPAPPPQLSPRSRSLTVSEEVWKIREGEESGTEPSAKKLERRAPWMALSGI